MTKRARPSIKVSSWDFPLSRPEKARRILEFYATDAEQNQRDLAELQSRNECLTATIELQKQQQQEQQQQQQQQLQRRQQQQQQLQQLQIQHVKMPPELTSVSFAVDTPFRASAETDNNNNNNNNNDDDNNNNNNNPRRPTTEISSPSITEQTQQRQQQQTKLQQQQPQQQQPEPEAKRLWMQADVAQDVARAGNHNHNNNNNDNNRNNNNNNDESNSSSSSSKLQSSCPSAKSVLASREQLLRRPRPFSGKEDQSSNNSNSNSNSNSNNNSNSSSNNKNNNNHSNNHSNKNNSKSCSGKEDQKSEGQKRDSKRPFEHEGGQQDARKPEASRSARPPFVPFWDHEVGLVSRCEGCGSSQLLLRSCKSKDCKAQYCSRLCQQISWPSHRRLHKTAEFRQMTHQ
ncbi:unnamed protein product [Polarella glacialis]|uniref:MYND-type domain-containing protein n=1 Tax=Polarella glacialis TaxID=89957 RepID=A0A813LNL0_POLGL|nr:unnamed protein product [Polarella glacialis]